MTNFKAQRENLVEGQIRPHGVTDPRIADAVRAVPRENFVPKALRAVAYMEDPVEIAPGRALMPAMSFARMVQVADLEGHETALDIGCGFGYSAAVLSSLVDTVIALEDTEEMVAAAEEKLADLEIGNVAVVHGALNEGVASQGPYDVIFLEGSVEQVPDTLLDQLVDGGRLIAVVNEDGRGEIRTYVKDATGASDRSNYDALVPALPGFEKPQAFTL
ncbi:MAG: protein-L-isoaspartate O-methyltransferase family protein [Alphaproteobacteria bacterium]